jgi:hypothetical protein
MVLSQKELAADIEAEDIEFGVHEQELALDVDGDLAEEDPEGLDSDDEDGVNAELGIDIEECDGNFFDVLIFDKLKQHGSSPNARRTSILALAERETNASL